MGYNYQGLIRRLLETGEVFICGPDGSRKNFLRAYAYGGLLCRIPNKYAASTSLLTMPSSAYIQKKYIEHYKEAVELLRGEDLPKENLSEEETSKEDVPFCWPSGNDARRRLLESRLDVLLPAMRKWSEKNQKERGVQTAISLRYIDYSKTGIVVCDFEHCIPAKLYREGFKNMLGVLPEADKKPECDLILFSETSEGKPVFTLVELKCNKAACINDKSGLKAHALDMLAASRIPDHQYEIELLRRLQSMVEHHLLKGVTADLEYWLAHPEGVILRRGFLFTRGSGLQDAKDAARICEEYVPEQHDAFLYLFCDDAQSVDFSCMESWSDFCKHK